MKYIKPMLLGTQDHVNSDKYWLYEPKYDGIRLLVGNRHSYTRHGTITTSRFPELLFGGDELLLDGELIAPGTDAPDNFSGAMSRFSGNNEQPISFMVFDIISYLQASVTYWPIEERKELLTEVISKIDSPYINLVPYVATEGEQLFNVIKENSMEGIIAKRIGSLYLPGTRSDDWRKIINWSYHDVVVSKVSLGPLTVQLHSPEGEYLGSVAIGFTKEIREKLLLGIPPFVVKVRAKGWTSGKKLRLPQIIEIK
ncbi:ATP-dependent DNA ligase [Sporosarcina psychrophila]|uniref:Polydeoxyribonucleotide synthase [ATP] n=1 Tax=Sporosarcina psychrophila TaxID=1476 RepID=A0ABV2KAR4_SPOPS